MGKLLKGYIASWLDVKTKLPYCCVGQDCEYRYTRQPPAELSCNPYDLINRLALTCSVEGPNTPIFSIVWFRRTNGALRDEELQITQSRVLIDVKKTLPAQFTRVSSRLTLTGLNDVTDVGVYWCQAKLENGTIFPERSTTLTLSNEDRYRFLSRCSGSSVLDAISCISVQQTIGPIVTDGGISTDPGAVEWTFSSSDISTSQVQTTGNPIDETEDNGRNLIVLYAIAAATVIASVTVLLLLIIMASIKYNQQATKAVLNHYEESQSDLGEMPRPDTSPVNDHEDFDLKDNSAYNKVGKIILNVNVSYVTTTVPSRSNIPQEYEAFVPSQSSKMNT